MTDRSAAPAQRAVPTQTGLKSGSKGKEVVDLQGLLAELGHLEIRPPAEGGEPGGPPVLEEPGVFDKATEAALRAFQELRGLRPSGVLDDSTIAVMLGISCRVVIPRRGLLPGDHYPFRKRLYTYRIRNGHDRIPPNVLPHAVAQAFSLWAADTPLAFLPTASDEYDFSLRFENLGGMGGLLGNALIEFDSEELWTIAPSDLAADYDFITTATHEIGHALGLNHNVPGVGGSVMNETQPTNWALRNLHPVDVANIQAIHGRPEVLLSDWVHGHSAQPETPDRLRAFTPERPHATALGNRDFCWFHLSIPTHHQVAASGPLRLNAVLLGLTTFAGAQISVVDAWDGATFLGRHFLSLSNPYEAVPTHTWHLRLGIAHKPLVRTAVGVSVLVKFTSSGDDARIHINAAGAEFVGGMLTPLDFGMAEA